MSMSIFKDSPLNDRHRYNNLNEERSRLCTFNRTNYLRDYSAISPMLLAQQGFAYSGLGDLVICVFCSMRKDDWQQCDDVREIHRVSSPACPMVTGAECGNIPLSTVFGQRMIHEDFEPRLQGNGLSAVCQTLLVASRQEEPMEVTTSPSVVNTSIPPAPYCSSDNPRPESNSSSSFSPDQIQSSSTNQLELSTNFSTAKPFESSPLSNQLQASTISTNQLEVPDTTTTNNDSNGNSSSRATNMADQNTNNSSCVNNMANQNTNNSSRVTNMANQNANSLNHSGEPTFAQLNVITSRPKRYEYAVRHKRLQTFKDWPNDHHITKEQMVDAGFYYGGYSDCCRCFYCGQGMYNWEPEDEPIVEHARWYPNCGFLRQQIGQDFIVAVAHFAVDHEKITLQMVATYLGKSVSYLRSCFEERNEPLLRCDSTVKIICELGYSMDDVIPIATKLRETIHRSDEFLSIVDLFNELLWNDVPQQLDNCTNLEWLRPSIDMDGDLRSLNKLLKKIIELRQRTLCKVCLDKEVEVTFLACKHRVCCNQCSFAVKVCPVCRERIQGTVHGFVA